MIALDPGDVIDLVISGRSRAFRINRISDAGARAIEAQRTEATVYAPPLPGITPPTADAPPTYGAAILSLMDLPILIETDVPWAPYAAASASPFAGILVQSSATGSHFAPSATLPIRATMGETLSPFNAGPFAYWDRTNTLSLKLYAGELASRPLDDILAGGTNALAIETPEGGDWEIVQFARAELAGTATYNVSQLLRGRLGTEHAMRAPLPVGARVVLLDHAVAQLGTALAERGQARFYRFGPPGLDAGDPAWQQTTFTARAVGLMPWAPVHLQGKRNGADDLAMTWVRRTRFAGIWADGTDVPLNEEREAYEIDILDGGSVVRTLFMMTPTVTYTAEQQTADFGAPPSAVAVKLYQLSATVGRGRPTSAIL